MRQTEQGRRSLNPMPPPRARRYGLEHGRDAPADLLVEVEQRLAEAGLTLARLPGYNPAPDMLHVLRDDLSDDELPTEVLRPTSLQISRMDEAFKWIGHLPPLPDRYRLLVIKRLIRSARTGNYRYSWTRLGKALDVSHHTAKAWHAQAMRLIAQKITEP